MRFTLPARPFNNMVRTMKKIIKSEDIRRISTRIHFQIFSTAPSVFYFRAMVTDGYRFYEDTIEVSGVERVDDIVFGSFNVPRLAAKSQVAIDATSESVIVSFDDVAFTSRPLRMGVEETEPIDKLIKILGDTHKTISKPERLSVCCNPKYLMEAVEGFKDCYLVRIDIGSMYEPIILTGKDPESSVLRMVMPKRSSVQDSDYRENISKIPVPTSKELTQPLKSESEEDSHE